MGNQGRRVTEYTYMPEDGWTIRDGNQEITAYPYKIIGYGGRELIFQQQIRNGRVSVTVPGFVISGQYGKGMHPFTYNDLDVLPVRLEERGDVRERLKVFATGEIDFWD